MENTQRINEQNIIKIPEIKDENGEIIDEARIRP